MTPTPYNLYNFETNFRLYLKKRGFAEISIRNYLVDLHHFFRWLKIYGGGLSSAEEYKNFLFNTRLPPYILNRRLATLKKFSDFCLSQKLSRETGAQKGNRKAREEILEKFTNFLKKEGRKPATIKNYSADVRQFLNWAKLKT